MPDPIRHLQNKLTGYVQSTRECAVMCEVVVRLDIGGVMVAIITRDSAENFDIRVGKRVVVGFKASETLIAIP